MLFGSYLHDSLLLPGRKASSRKELILPLRQSLFFQPSFPSFHCRARPINCHFWIKVMQGKAVPTCKLMKFGKLSANFQDSV